MRGKAKLWAWAVSVLSALVLVLGLSGTAYAAVGDDVPDHAKTITDNGDGTYTLSLSVTGDAERQPNNVNVIVVFDRSGSMTAQRMNAAKSAVDNLANSLFAYNTSESPDTVQMALVSFSTNATITRPPTTSYQQFSQSVNGLVAGGGTNWEDALEEAGNVSFGDDDQTFVIFVSDGNPTFRNTRGTTADLPRSDNPQWVNTYIYNQMRGDSYFFGSDGVYGLGSDNPSERNYSPTSMQRCYDNALDEARAIASAVGADRFFTIGAYGDVSRMQALTAASGAPATNFYDADNTDALNQALADILSKIEMAGIGNATITDGTTSNVSTSTGPISLLEVDTSSFKYYRAGGSYSTTANGGLGDAWAEAPVAAFANGAVAWDLTSEGVLEDGVTYTVTFDAYPSQTALDYAARLKNGEAYEDVVPEEAREYFKEDGSLHTNTAATLSYDDTRDEEGLQNAPYVNPDPVATQTEHMDVQKLWEGDAAPDGDLDLIVEADGNEFATVTINSANEWQSKVNISCGIIKNGEALPGATGHDFVFSELPSVQYHWEIDAPTVRPMIIDGETTMLVKQDADHQAPDGATTYEIGGSTYYVDSEVSRLQATNYRRSNLNLAKEVTGEGAPADALFPFTLKVVNSKADNGSPNDLNSDYYVWFSIQDATGSLVTDDGRVTSGATAETDDMGSKTGYYYAASGASISVNLKADESLRFINLPSGTTYTFEEGDADGFKFVKAENTGESDSSFAVNGKTATGTVEAPGGKSFAVTYTNEYALVDVTVTKVWDDANDQDGKRPDELELTLDGLPTGTTGVEPTVTKNADGTWVYAWTGLPKYDSAGNLITYTVTENDEPEGYTCDTPTVNSGGTITNSHTPETTEATVVKVWDDEGNQDGIRPSSLEVTLSDGTTVTLSAANGWTATVTGLPKYADGQEIAYTWAEALPDGYELADTSVEGTVTTLTNSYTPATIDLEVTKVWDDADDQDGIRPTSITVNVFDGEKKVASTSVTADEDWSYTFTDLPKYANGQEIEYTVTEDAVTGYDPTVDGYTITNTHRTDTIDLEVTKVWDDADDQDGKRPTSVFVQLYAGDEPVGELVELNEENEWTYTWAGLDKNASGAPIEYKVEEVPVDDYESEIEETETGYLITNIHEPELTEIDVTKIWNDADDQDGIRPGSITVNVFDGEKKVASASVTAAENWSYTFTDLPKYADGQEIAYTVTEDEVTGYEPAIDGYAITNSHDPEVTSVEVAKVWDDADNKDGIRPASVTVNLLADDVVIDSQILSEDNGWTYEWTDLAANKAGKEIAYTVTEDEVAGYDAPEITGTASEGYVIKNHHTATPDAVTSDPPVQKIVQGTPATPATFTFRMKAVTTGAPMPEGSVDGVKTTQITGTGSSEFGIMTYTGPGEWTYEITEVNDGAANYTYDATVYTLTVKVVEVAEGTQVKLVKTETVTGGNGAVVFTNTYKEPVPEEPKKPQTPTPQPIPKTGDVAPQAGTIALVAALVTGIAAVGALRRED